MRKKCLIGTTVAVMMIAAVITGCGKTKELSNAELNEMLHDEVDLDNAVINGIDADISDISENDFIPTNDMEARVGRGTFESYDEIIGLLEGDEAYGYANILGQEEPVLFIAQEVVGHGDGTWVALEATPYTMKADGTISADSMLFSGGTATPISVDSNGLIYCATHTTLDKYCYGDNGSADKAIMSMMYIYVDSFDDEGRPQTVGGFVRTNNSLIEDDSTDISADSVDMFNKAFEDFDKAEPIRFTSVS